MWKVAYAVQIQGRECRKLLTKAHHPLHFLVEAILVLIYIKFYHPVTNRCKNADGLYNSVIHKKYGHIPSPLIMFTCTMLRNALLEWQMHKGVHPKASKSKLKADRPDSSNYFNHQNEGDKNAACCCAQVVNLAGHCRHIYMLDEYLEHTTGKLPTAGV
jgi:hypothetical protein